MYTYIYITPDDRKVMDCNVNCVNLSFGMSKKRKSCMKSFIIIKQYILIYYISIPDFTHTVKYNIIFF